MEIVQAVKKLNSISLVRLKFRRRPILCITLYRNPIQASIFGGSFDQLLFEYFYYRKRGSASYIMREVRSVRERERERETDRQRQREKDGSDVTIFAQKLAMSLHFSLPKICTLVSPLLNCPEFTLSVAKNVALFETVPILRKIRTVKWRERGSKQPNNRSNFRLHRPSSHRKNESN